MWDEPYLETCCRSALHRLLLCADAGRPQNLRDQPCLERLCRMGFAQLRNDGRFEIVPAGQARHDKEIGKLAPAYAGARRHPARISD
ncbi:hypothetical protein [Neoasaia chiangmaiensis]|uniref:Uncharacterized protein n=1 Tax=Neoasaia chiangmaiensis TaxID=320497 RepID=A0A1U9KT55_9PROT|nr:hypothetical protein [Neoasaia chiangmaiensis]AQS88919.1 hypothetical protein A0U93_14445 [Neoasaia chiangmaiensis]